METQPVVVDNVKPVGSVVPSKAARLGSVQSEESQPGGKCDDAVKAVANLAVSEPGLKVQQQPVTCSGVKPEEVRSIVAESASKLRSDMSGHITTAVGGSNREIKVAIQTMADAMSSLLKGNMEVISTQLGKPCAGCSAAEKHLSQLMQEIGQLKKDVEVVETVREELQIALEGVTHEREKEQQESDKVIESLEAELANVKEQYDQLRQPTSSNSSRGSHSSRSSQEHGYEQSRDRRRRHREGEHREKERVKGRRELSSTQRGILSKFVT
ncbi:hypothetical protein CMUS01_16780 [Colletotrichum musicola]|uniref:Uncharacterized protein n=2 Tax=Colletotrichum orchidearum species complex TaxID=2707337 RepID=A0A8H6MF21_9PEZI|nr:hypothetical protein CSOJ01_16110 [Colletotrichum sojae]KAF6781324.1 hypothetical protein CMUS01_16780 [Colletotrichum musicola]